VIQAFVLEGLVLLTEVKIVESIHLCYHAGLDVASCGVANATGFSTLPGD